MKALIISIMQEHSLWYLPLRSIMDVVHLEMPNKAAIEQAIVNNQFDVLFLDPYHATSYRAWVWHDTFTCQDLAEWLAGKRLKFAWIEGCEAVERNNPNPLVTNWTSMISQGNLNGMVIGGLYNIHDAEYLDFKVNFRQQFIEGLAQGRLIMKLYNEMITANPYATTYTKMQGDETVRLTEEVEPEPELEPDPEPEPTSDLTGIIGRLETISSDLNTAINDLREC